jgi:hypothetical protein
MKSTILLSLIVALLVAHIFHQWRDSVDRQKIWAHEIERDDAARALADVYIAKFDALSLAMDRNTDAVLNMKRELIEALQAAERE